MLQATSILRFLSLRRSHNIIVSLCLVLVFVSCRTAPGSIPNAVHTFLDRVVDEHELTGLTAAIYADDKLQTYARGMSDTSQQIIMKPSDCLMSGSTGKTFVAAIVMKLIEEGQISLDDHLRKWLGTVSFFNEIPNADDITIRMLLSHRTGWIQHVFESKQFIGELLEQLKSNPDKYYKPEELFYAVTYDEALFEAGTSHHYSDMNYIGLGLIIEKVTGKAFYSVLKEEILAPFNLTRTIPADRRNLPCLVNGYMKDDDPFAFLSSTSMIGPELAFNPSVEWTGGGLVTNSGDLAKWASILWSGDWLSEGSVDQMCAIEGDADYGYGFGTQVVKTELGWVFGHGGYFPGYRTMMGYFPEHDIGVAIQINRDHEVGSLLAHMTMLAQAYLADNK